MYTGKQETRWVGSSPFISTYEPIDLPKNVTRILLEGHSTHSNRTVENNGQLSESGSEVLTLLTIVLLNPMINLELTRVAAVLVELVYESESELDDVFEDGESLSIDLGGIPQVVRKTGPHQDQFGIWEWSTELLLVPLKLIDRTVQGKLRISGRGCQLPRELREVGLDGYWEGRATHLDEFKV